MAEQRFVKCLIAGTARNIASSWDSVKKSLQTIFHSVDEYRCVIVESNSNDATLPLLKAWETEDSRRTVITLGHLNEPSRTKRIAVGRNAYMDFFETSRMFDSFDYLIVVDLDSSLQIEPSFKEQLDSCFARDDWDGIGSNRRGRYYDIWALRSAVLGCTFDCWDMVNKSIGIQGGKLLLTYPEKVQAFVSRFQTVLAPSSAWIPCESAFGCMALYKVKSVRHRRYNGDTTCEHVSFHSGLRMFINPQLMSGSDSWEHCGQG